MIEENRVMGIDIGGTGVKAALVDTQTGRMTTERVRLPTPQPATPAAVMEDIEELRRQLQWRGTVGCGFPGLVKSGRVQRAPNLDSSWIGYDLADQLRVQLGRRWWPSATMPMPRDLAEFRFGAGQGVTGTVLVITLGTGVGSAVFATACSCPTPSSAISKCAARWREKRAAASMRTNRGLSWKKWAKRLNDYLVHVEYLLGVDLFIIGRRAQQETREVLPLPPGCRLPGGSRAPRKRRRHHRRGHVPARADSDRIPDRDTSPVSAEATAAGSRTGARFREGSG